MSVGRNEKCPCGSGKKYKNCCLQKDLEAARVTESAAVESARPIEEGSTPKYETWKIFLLVTAILGVVGLLVTFAGAMPRLGGAIFGIGMIILVVYCAFRNIPTVRERPGDAGNIDFGNRQ